MENYLQEYMDRAGLNQSQLAQKAGLDQPQISQYISGIEPKIRNAHAIACVLGVSTHDIWPMLQADKEIT